MSEEHPLWVIPDNITDEDKAALEAHIAKLIALSESSELLEEV